MTEKIKNNQKLQRTTSSKMYFSSQLQYVIGPAQSRVAQRRAQENTEANQGPGAGNAPQQTLPLTSTAACAAVGVALGTSLAGKTLGFQ